MKRLEIYSLATVRIYCLAVPNKEKIQRATGFLLKHNNKTYLITNDHVVSGLGHGDRKILSETGAIPGWLEINLILPSVRGFSAGNSTGVDFFNITMPLYKDPEACLEPEWISHPQLGHRVDVVALDIQPAIENAGINPPVTLSFSQEESVFRPMDLSLIHI